MPRSARLFVAWGLLAFWLVGIGPLCWILRDGLGPNSVESSGWHALIRFNLTFFWGPVALLLAGFVVLVTLWRPRT